MNLKISMLAFVLVVASQIAGCGGSSPSGKENVGDGRSIILKVNEAVDLGNGTQFAVRSIQDNRCAEDAGCIAYNPSIVTATMINEDKSAPGVSVDFQDQKEEYVTAPATGLTYLIVCDKIAPDRGLYNDRIQQEDFRLTFRLKKVP